MPVAEPKPICFPAKYLRLSRAKGCSASNLRLSGLQVHHMRILQSCGERHAGGEGCSCIVDKRTAGAQFGDMRGFWGIWHAGLSQLRKKTGVIQAHVGEGTANTALVYHANKLMSLHEGDLPYAVRRPSVSEVSTCLYEINGACM